jgi:phosphoglycolate phosphatase-like HAD superfamily hydrolase
MNQDNNEILLTDLAKEEINEFDSIIFDCDGVLIDVTKSYDTTINKTISYILKEIFNITVDNPLTNEMFVGFKSTGGFNDEVDITYVGILCYIAAQKLNKNSNEFIFDVIENANSTGIKSVEDFFNQIDVDLTDEILKLNYPTDRKTNPVSMIFNELFYGPELYNKIFKKDSRFSENGFIENDSVIINIELIKKLKQKFNNKLAIVTGRGYQAILPSLKEILNEFDIKNSVFLEDESRDLAKPNPKSLIQTIQGLDSKNSLYVGDSMEDLILSKKASELGFQTTFCGIYGSGKLPEIRKKLFIEQNVPIILESINFLPKALNLV